jgi:GNAT superfamily N-acetyltransferase
MALETDSAEAHDHDLEVIRADHPDQLPEWAPREALERFFNEKMQPWHDRLEDVARGLEYAFSDLPGMGGFVLAAGRGERLVGGVTILQTGMKGYIPENLLLFIGVDPELRNQGIGRKLMERAIAECDGDIKLHVEKDNPAMRLYERCGFAPKYVEMRYIR